MLERTKVLYARVLGTLRGRPPLPPSQVAKAEPPAQGRAAAAEVLAGRPLALGHKPNLPITQFWTTTNPPRAFILGDIERMLEHPQVAISFSHYCNGTAPAKFVIKAKNPEVQEFVQKEWKRFWLHGRPMFRYGYAYGWLGCEVCYRLENGRLGFDQLIPFGPRDAKPLTRDHMLVGVRVQRVEDNDLGTVDLWGPGYYPAKGLWFAHKPHYNRWYGRSQLYGAWRPWRRLATRDGGEEIIDGGVYRFAYQGPVVRFPPGSSAATVQQAGAEAWDNAEYARQMGEQVKAGAVIALPNTVDPITNQPQWAFEWPQTVINVDSLLNYNKSLKDEISLGIEVPPEILQASDTGSGYSGREIPKESYFLMQDANVIALIVCWRYFLGDPLVNWNFGPDQEYTIEPLPLLQAQQQSAGGGVPPGPGNQGQQPPPERLPPNQTALSTLHAPPGGIDVGGEHFQGGQFIPDAAFKRLPAKARFAVKKSIKIANRAARRSSPDVVPPPPDFQPRAVKWAKRAWTAYNATYHAGLEAATEVAKAHGFDDDRASRLRRALFYADLAHGIVASVPMAANVAGLVIPGVPRGLGDYLVHAVGLDHTLAAAAAMAPAASLTYLAYATAKRPLDTLRAAFRAIRRVAKTVRGQATLSTMMPYDQAGFAQALALHLDSLPVDKQVWFEALLIAALAQVRDPTIALHLAVVAMNEGKTTLATVAQSPWVQLPSQGKTKKWHNRLTGETRYQDEMPGARSAQTKTPPPPTKAPPPIARPVPTPPAEHIHNILHGMSSPIDIGKALAHIKANPSAASPTLMRSIGATLSHYDEGKLKQVSKSAGFPVGFGHNALSVYRLVGTKPPQSAAELFSALRKDLAAGLTPNQVEFAAANYQYELPDSERRQFWRTVRAAVPEAHGQGNARMLQAYAAKGLPESHPITGDNIRDRIAAASQVHEIVKRVSDVVPDTPEKSPAYQELNKKIDEVNTRLRSSKTPQERRESQKEYDNLRITAMQFRYRWGDQRTAARRALVEALTVEKPARLEYTIDAKGDSAIEQRLRGYANEADDFLGDIVNHPVTVPIHLVYVSNVRANCSISKPEGRYPIEVSSTTRTGVYVHEIGHALEAEIPGLHEKCQAFLDHRCGSEEPTKLNEKFPGSGYADHERGRKDQFEKAWGPGSSAYYVGKEYDGNTEVFSMGLEQLYENPSFFCRQDPEYAAFLIGCLQGVL